MQSNGHEFQQQMETRHDFVVLLDSEGMVLYSNSNWINYCTRRRLSEKLWKTGENYLDFLEKEKKSEELQSIMTILNEQAIELTRLTTYHSFDGAESFSVNYKALQSESGKEGALLYKLPLHYLPAESLKTEAALESMSDAFYLLDDQLNFYYVNAKSESLLRLKKEELLGRNIWTVFPDLVETAFYPNYTRAIEKKISVQFKEFYAPLNHWFTVRATPIKTGGLAIYCQMISNSETTEGENAEHNRVDYLTGLPKRKQIDEKIEKMLLAKTPFSLLYINLDNFKNVNLLHNRDKGDKVLTTIASDLKSLLASGEMAGRLDGDEFILLHHLSDQEEVKSFPKLVRNLFAQPFVLENSQPITVNASIGVVSYPQDSQMATELISYAETAMRDAKKQIGSSYSLFHPDMATDLSRQLLIKKGLSGDLKAFGFHFAVQPQINCSTGELKGIEVLARWQHPELGPISPFEFIGIAEETGTIYNLTNHLLHEVFSFISQNKNLFRLVPKTAINVTPSLLTSKMFFEDLFRLMEKYGIPPESIELEITESVELTVSEITLQNLLACRTKGISIALDDFGTGYSMLAYLLDFPVDTIKLDKLFVSKIGYDEKSEAVLQSLIQFVTSIGCELVAEGVETENEAAFLVNNGCSIHQGYFYARPIPPERFIAYYLTDDMATGLRIH